MAASSQQRSKSFDSASTVTTTTVLGVGNDDANTPFLEVPRRFQRRRSSNTKTSPPACIHCHYLEEYRRQISADQLYFIDHQEVRTLSYSDTSSSDENDDDNDDEDDGDAAENSNGDESSAMIANRYRVASEPRQLLLPPPTGRRFSPPENSPPACNIRFTLSPTASEMPTTFIDLESPPITPRIPSPPPPFVTFDLDRLASESTIESTTLDYLGGSGKQPPAGDLPSPCGSQASSNCYDDGGGGWGAGQPPTLMPRTRRRSISRQEAVFVEPVNNSLENVAADTEMTTTTTASACSGGSGGRIPSIRSSDDDLDEPEYQIPCSLFQHLTQDNVCDIFLTVPDLKRDRAASVDSCFSKVHSSGVTEEVQPPPDGGLTLTVPQGSAVRSRSVDIVLPTEAQARYKALALAGPNSYGQYQKG